MKYIFFTIFLASITISVFAQNFTISGYITDKKNGEGLIGAAVYVKELKQGTITNTYGFYSITLPKGNYQINYSYLGYKTVEVNILLNTDQKISQALDVSDITTDEVVVSAERGENVESSQMGNIALPIQQIKPLPAFMGEVDILKTIQLLPGVQSAGEGNSGFYVRGGGPDQNLILFDEAVVYNASHLFGFFSVFNADAINSVNLIKGGMPAQYGGRLSSVLEISMKDGNNQEFEAEGGIGLIASRLTLQGPIKKGVSSYLVSGRRTYLDILVNPFIKSSSPYKGSGYYFYDFNAKINYRFSDNDRLYLSMYYGKDVFSFKQKESGFNLSVPWGNATASLRWNHLFSDKLFMNTSLVFSDYNFEFGGEQEDFEMKLFSGIRDYNAKLDFTYMPLLNHQMKFGVNYTYHIFTPSSVSARIGTTTINADDVKDQLADETALYFNYDFDISENLKMSAGLRGTLFSQLGPFDRFVNDEFGRKEDTIHYKRGERVANYKNLEPRFSVRYSLTNNSSLKAAYTQNYQYIHLANISSVSLPTDLWVPSSTIVKPQFSQQYAIGYFHNFHDNVYETSIELYYKKMENMIEYAEGMTPGDNLSNNTDNNLTFGDGLSYGAEFFIKKAIGKTTGWIGYTLSRTTRQFENINNGKVFPAKYDRTHDLSFTLTHIPNIHWSFSTVFVFATGNSLTLPIGRYFIEGQILSQYGTRNSYRMEPYHRLDLSVTYTPESKGRWQSSWNFSIYNVYSRQNPYFIYFETEGNIQDGSLKTSAKQVSLFPIIPSVTYNFKF